MWKYICRGVRARCSNRTSATADQGRRSAVTQENKIPCPLRLVPCFLDLCQRHLSQLGIIQNFDANNGKSGHKSNKSSTEDSFRSENINNYQPCPPIIGAVGWTGVLVLGWTIIQPWYRHKERRQKPCIEPDINPDSLKRYSGIYKLLLNPVFSQPVNNHILPTTNVKSDDRHLQQSSSTSSPPPCLPTSEPESKILTPEEAFDEAAEEVRWVHERVVGEAENRRGIACLSHRNDREAIKHFKIASAFKNAPAAFNLGQCFELGIGTKQDFAQAAHWYQVASEMGHPAATYNLGVFYAHGWGGLDADSRQAKKLFITAAALGQPEAQAALNLQTKNVNLNEKTESEKIPENFESKLAFDFFKMNKIKLQFTDKRQISNNLNKKIHDLSVFYRPDSSLPSSPSLSSQLSSSSSSSASSTNDDPLMFNQEISTIEESSKTCSETNSSDDWQTFGDIVNVNGNSATLYRLAECYENSSHSVDPELILQLYRMAADHGHQRAKLRLKILEEHYALGTLDNYLRSSKKKKSSVADCTYH
ncbi:uncharacterized protein LOC142328485 [Lycorma delicatula]|uniref:uncharacterized protein LOC142328485 n=1 Tax=Lycorma delicatula TaxID=130591 RepID=UPI003F51565C